MPSLINHEWEWDDPALNALLEEAQTALGRLDGSAALVPDIDLYIAMHKAKEANASSRIEGTRTEIDDAFLSLEDVLPEKRDDWAEVHNYLEAMDHSLQALATLPLSTRLLREAHARLLQGVRGEHKDPGEFRRSQNWIGGSSPADAVYVPPPHTEVPALMGDLEKFWHNDTIQVPRLVRAAIIHYQFETIHPFLDGNGRIGRLLITLYLVASGLLTRPCLYVSDYFERNRSAYIDTLERVRNNHDLSRWVRFFCTGVRETAVEGNRTFGRILELEKNCRERIAGVRQSSYAVALLRLLFSRPILNVADAKQAIKASFPTVNALFKNFLGAGIVTEITGNRRNRLFAFREYLEIFRR